jgi:hypothetical protein
VSQCAPCGPLPVAPCAGVVTITQGYSKTYFFSLFYSDSGAPYDLTGALQIVASHPTPLPLVPLNEYLTAQTALVTTGNVAASSPTLTGLASTVGVFPGQTVTGAGIPADTTVVGIPTATSVTLSADATTNGVGVTLTFTTATNLTIVGAPGGGRCQVVMPPYDTAALQVNPNPPTYQDLQVSVTNADGSTTAFLLANVLNIVAPPFGVQ